MDKKTVNLLIESNLSIIFNFAKSIPLIIFCYFTLGILLIITGASYFRVTDVQNQEETLSIFFFFLVLIIALGITTLGVLLIQECWHMGHIMLEIKQDYKAGLKRTAKGLNAETDIIAIILDNYHTIIATAYKIWRSSGRNNIFFGSAVLMFTIGLLLANINFFTISAGCIFSLTGVIFFITGLILLKKSKKLKINRIELAERLKLPTYLEDTGDLLFKSQINIIKCIDLAVTFFIIIAIFGIMGSFVWGTLLFYRGGGLFLYGILVFVLGISAIFPVKSFIQGVQNLKQRVYNTFAPKEELPELILFYQGAVCSILGNLYKSDVKFSIIAGIACFITGLIDIIFGVFSRMAGGVMIVAGIFSFCVGLSINSRVRDCVQKFDNISSHLSN